jgi:hypothetical protein
MRLLDFFFPIYIILPAAGLSYFTYGWFAAQSKQFFLDGVK